LVTVTGTEPINDVEVMAAVSPSTSDFVGDFVIILIRRRRRRCRNFWPTRKGLLAEPVVVLPEVGLVPAGV
jgi:hypothetical protein